MTLLLGIAVNSSVASAADLPVRDAPSPYGAPPTEFDWTGLYIGVNAGYGLDHVPFAYSVTTPLGTAAGFSAHGINERGPLAGGQIGYNTRLDEMPFVGPMFDKLPLVSSVPFLENIIRHIVTGVEADADWADINGHLNLATNVGPALVGTRIQNFGTLRSRVGYSYDHFLVYLFSGLSFATTQNYYSVAGFSGAETITRAPLRTCAYGIGVEYALTNAWSVKVEYMYDYIAAYTKTFAPAPNASVSYLSRTTFDELRAGLNYKLDVFGSSPVVARY